MLQIEKILFPTDLSACAERAFGHAAYLADRYDAALHMLHVVEEPESNSYDLRGDRILSEADIAEQLHVALGAPKHVPFKRIVQIERQAPSATEAILGYAESHDIDLVVMGTHGRRGLDRLMIGSVAEEVVRLSPCPVLTIRTDEPVPRRAIRKVLLPMDLSAHSRAALRYALALAEDYDAQLDVLHVVEPNFQPGHYGVDIAIPITEEVRAYAAEFLRKLVAEATTTTQIETTITVGHPTAELLAYADAQEVDLIVIATHGRSGLQHFLMGSVVEKVVRHAPCPVFTVKSFGRGLLQKSAATVQHPQEVEDV